MYQKAELFRVRHRYKLPTSVLRSLMYDASSLATMETIIQLRSVFPDQTQTQRARDDNSADTPGSRDGIQVLG